MKPRVGFLGVGWIGRHRMGAMMETGAIQAAAVADPSAEMREEASRMAPSARLVGSFEELLGLSLDGIVIATPSALHASQAIAALDRGLAVFCQKPLGRSAAEVQSVVSAARAANRLIEVDLSYRETAGMRAIRDLVRAGELGTVFAADLVFHNAYGPDKPWFYDRALSGGGCLVDLGVHLVDLALWTLDYPEILTAVGELFAAGRRLPPAGTAVEDFASATLAFGSGVSARIACSWRLHAGREAEISATFYGDKGGARMRNVEGSFYDFVAERFIGTTAETLAGPPDAWNVRAAERWARRLAAGDRYDPEAERIIVSADALDRIYAGAARL